MSSAGPDWESLDWEALDRMRDAFLAGTAGREDYWRSRSDLANYDHTFAQRIGWKWDAVLRELKRLGWIPPAGPLIDWGCGSGIAGRCLLDAFGDAGIFTGLRLFDCSRLAMTFAAERARHRFPRLDVETCNPVALAEAVPGATLLVSHVLNELGAPDRAELLRLAAQASALLWVEPGTHPDSTSLIAIREQLRSQFTIVAPCPHQGACGLLQPGMERHWCHFFADPPPGVMADSGWVRFAQRAGVDLRSLPYSYLVMERRGVREAVPGLPASGATRPLGAPRLYKGFARLFTCRAEGVSDLTIQRRDEPDSFRQFKASREMPLRRP
jgi:hypothetical protein